MTAPLMYQPMAGAGKTRGTRSQRSHRSIHRRFVAGLRTACRTCGGTLTYRGLRCPDCEGRE